MFRPSLMKIILWAFQVDAKNRYDTDTFTSVLETHRKRSVVLFGAGDNVRCSSFIKFVCPIAIINDRQLQKTNSSS